MCGDRTYRASRSDWTATTPPTRFNAKPWFRFSPHPNILPAGEKGQAGRSGVVGLGWSLVREEFDYVFVVIATDGVYFVTFIVNNGDAWFALGWEPGCDADSPLGVG